MNENNEPIEDIEEEIQEEAQESTPQPKTAEDVARAGGWKPLDEWTGDPAEWRSAEVFNERGEWIQRHKAQEKRLNEIEASFSQRMENANKLHQKQLEFQKAELIRKRDEAIDLADRGAANGYQEEIDKLNTPEPTAAAPEQTNLDRWNEANPWIYQNNPKAAYAKQMFGAYQSQGMSADQALKAMEADVNREFPALNPGRDKQPIPEGGTRPGSKRAGRKLTMADLSNEELKYYRAMPGAWKSEAEYLQAVQDIRGNN